MTKPQRATPHARRQFQSTPSVWRETCNLCRNAGCSMISIHSLRVEGDKQRCLKLQRPFSISIHSLRVEGDREHLHLAGGPRYFNPLPPCGGRPLLPDHHVQGRSISTHSLRVEGDVNGTKPIDTRRNFNPLPPCGGRRLEGVLVPVTYISIHSLRVEGDCLIEN